MIRICVTLILLWPSFAALAQDNERTSVVSSKTLAELKASLFDKDQKSHVEWQLVTTIPVPKKLADFSFSAESDGLVFCDTNGQSEAWRLSPATKLGGFKIDGSDFQVALSPDRKYGLVGGDFDAVIVWDTSTGEQVFKHDAFQATVEYLQVSADLQMIGADAAGGVHRYPLLGGQGYSLGVDPTKESLKAFSASSDGSRVLYTVTKNYTFILPFPSATVPAPRAGNIGGHLDGAEHAAFGTESFAAATNEWVKFIYPQPGPPGRVSIGERKFSLIGIHDMKITPDDALLGAITSHGQLHLMNPRTPSVGFVSAPPIKGPVTGDGDARLGPDCRTVAVHRGSRLQVWRVVSDPLSRQTLVQDILTRLLDSKQYDEVSSLTNEIIRQDESLYYELQEQLKPSSVPAKFDERVRQLEEWSVKIPKDLFPRLLLSGVESSKGWKIRGSGYADSVTEEQWEGFQKHIDVAAAYLDDYVPDEFTPGSYYAMRIALHTSQGSPYEEFRKTTDQLLKYRPNYIPAHERAVQHLMPRWHGEPGECAFYAANVAKAIGGEEGRKMYVYLAETQLSYYKTEQYFPITEFDYDEILSYLNSEAAKDLSVADRDRVEASLMRFARRKGDKETAQKTFARMIVDGWMARNKNNPRVYGDVMRTIAWLQGESKKGGISVPKGFLEGLLPPLPGSKPKSPTDSPKKPSKPAGGA